MPNKVCLTHPYGNVYPLSMPQGKVVEGAVIRETRMNEVTKHEEKVLILGLRDWELCLVLWFMAGFGLVSRASRGTYDGSFWYQLCYESYGILTRPFYVKKFFYNIPVPANNKKLSSDIA